MSGASARRTSRRVLVAGVVLAVAYVVLALLSGHLSPLSRRPTLDGLGPLMPYRWVAPPPEVEGTEAPTPGSFELRVRHGGTVPDVVFTPDAQVTMILDRGAIRSDDPVVNLDVTPLDPATLGPLPNDFETFGNAIEIRAVGEPSGEAASRFEDLIAILLYPETTSLHALTHELLYSADGSSWERLDTTESVVQQQVQAEMPGPGYLVVGGVPKVLTSPRPPGVDTGGVGTLPTILLVVSIVSLLLGVGLLLRSRHERVAPGHEPDPDP